MGRPLRGTAPQARIVERGDGPAGRSRRGWRLARLYKRSTSADIRLRHLHSCSPALPAAVAEPRLGVGGRRPLCHNFGRNGLASRRYRRFALGCQAVVQGVSAAEQETSELPGLWPSVFRLFSARTAAAFGKSVRPSLRGAKEALKPVVGGRAARGIPGLAFR